MNNPSKRYNTFNRIHKGLRAFMYETAYLVQQTDFSDVVAGTKALEQISSMLTMFESHAHSEDRFLNEPLEAVNPGIAAMFEKEHIEDHRLAAGISRLIDQWNASVNIEERLQAGTDIFYLLNEFIAFNLYHMNKEEIALNEVIWMTYTDGAIKGIEQKIVQHLPHELLIVSGKWMMRGLNNDEIIEWMYEVRALAPLPFFELLMGMAKENLNGERFQVIQRKLDEMSKAA